MYIACCPLVSHSEYADGTDRQTDRHTNGRQTVTLRFLLWTQQVQYEVNRLVLAV